MTLTKHTWILFLLFITGLQAQEPFYRSYKWEVAPKVTPTDTIDQSEGQAILKDLRVFEYAYEKSGDLVTYVTKHKLIKVFSDKGIESNNKVYIPAGGILEFMDIQARSISPAGKVTNIAKGDIKEIDDVDNKGSFKMFAVDGIEKNSEIEYVYTYKKNSSYFGTEYCQSAVPRYNFSFRILAPPNLFFEVKPYNFPASVKPDTSSGIKSSVTVTMDKIEALREEKYSSYEANLLRLEYKLAYNSVKGKMRLLTWDNAADRYYSVFYVYQKKEVSAVTSFLKKLDLKGEDADKVRKLESHIKTRYEIKQDNSDDAENLEKILNNKYGNTTGIIRLYMCCLQQMELKRELALTCNRTSGKFDPEFDTWNYLDGFLINLPAQGLFLYPGDLLSRLGFVPPEYTAQKGLFVKEVDLGEVRSGIAKIKEIPYPEMSLSSNNIEATATFNSDLTETSVALKQTFTGYDAYYRQPLINYFTDLQKREFQENTLKIIGEDAKMDKVEMSGYAEEDILTKPFVMSCVLRSPSLIDKASSKYLLKVGVLIGPQLEMYQESTRRTPIEITFTHGYTRKIHINIPEGYKISGTENLVMHETVQAENTVGAEFKSEFKLTGNALDITVIENYSKLFFPIEKFEDFRKVINAAANFNKVVLILEKK